MYSSPRTISTAISNNRLNFDERANRTIVVPSLITGTLDDVMTGGETVIEGEVSGKMTAGKGLQHFVFLKDAKAPTWIMDNHNHAFAFWHEAYWKGWIQKGALLVHIDQHTDLGTPAEMPKSRQSTKDKVQNNGSYIMSPGQGGVKTVKNPPFCPLPFVFCTLEEVEDYTNSVLTIADFIVPALSTGLISEALMVTGEDMHASRSFVWQMNNDDLAYRQAGGIMNNEGSLIKKSAQLGTINDKIETPKSLILDLDIDYFSQGFDELKCFETVRYWIEKADIITIATSPLFIDQEKALTVLKSLQNNLMVL